MDSYLILKTLIKCDAILMLDLNLMSVQRSQQLIQKFIVSTGVTF